MVDGPHPGATGSALRCCPRRQTCSGAPSFFMHCRRSSTPMLRRQILLALVAASLMLIGAAPANATYAAHVSDTPGLAGYWRLGETSGRTAFDHSRRGHDGTYLNRPRLGRPQVRPARPMGRSASTASTTPSPSGTPTAAPASPRSPSRRGSVRSARAMAPRAATSSARSRARGRAATLSSSPRGRARHAGAGASPSGAGRAAGWTPSGAPPRSPPMPGTTSPSRTTGGRCGST